MSCGKLLAARNYSFQNGRIIVSVACLLGLLAIFSVYVGYAHCKYTHIPAPKRDSFFLGYAPLITRELERGKIMDELHRIHGCVVLIWLYHEPLVFLSDPELARKCPVTLNLPKNPFSCTSLGFPFGQRMPENGLVTIDHGVFGSDVPSRTLPFTADIS